ncbi:hypothetical protein [Streptomyces harbinensis]
MSVVDVATATEEKPTVVEGVVLMDDLDALGDGSSAACNDDNPYQGS